MKAKIRKQFSKFVIIKDNMRKECGVSLGAKLRIFLRHFSITPLTQQLSQISAISIFEQLMCSSERK